MSNKRGASNPTSSQDRWGYGYVVSDNTPNVIIGRMLTLLEVMGLTEKQEKSSGDLIRQAIWDSFNEAVSITPERHSEIRETHYKMMNEARTNNVPPNAI